MVGEGVAPLVPRGDAKAVRTSAVQLLYCSCIVVVLHLCGPLNVCNK